MSRALAAFALLTLSALPAGAGELGVELQAGWFEMSAKHPAEAVFGSSGGATLGAAVRYNVWRGAFVAAGLRTFSQEGERVYLTAPGASLQKLGFPVSLELTPVLLTAGYRFRHGRMIVPYAHLGAAVTSWSEKSEVAGESFSDSGSTTGWVGAAGVELGRGLLRGGFELGYSTAPGAIGLGGVSKVYAEDDLGGFHVVGKLAVAFGL